MFNCERPFYIYIQVQKKKKQHNDKLKVGFFAVKLAVSLCVCSLNTEYAVFCVYSKHNVAFFRYFMVNGLYEFIIPCIVLPSGRNTKFIYYNYNNQTFLHEGNIL